MSDESKADDCAKLLDNKYSIVLFRSALGSYTAVACKPGESVEEAMECDRRITDDFTVTKALYRLSEKVTTGRIVGTP